MFEKCEICNKKAFIRCKEHNKCDKCGLTKEESISKNISLVHREDGLICDNCFKEMVNVRLENFEEDTGSLDDIICPYCGSVYGDPQEWSDGGEYECDDCKNKFEYNRDVSVNYSTNKIKDIGEEE